MPRFYGRITPNRVIHRPAVTLPRTSHRSGNAHSAAGLGAEARHLGIQVERADALTAVEVGLFEPVGGDQPDDLELEPVGVLGIQALGGAVVGRADERARRRQALGQRCRSASVSTSHAKW